MHAICKTLMDGYQRGNINETITSAKAGELRKARHQLSNGRTCAERSRKRWCDNLSDTVIWSRNGSCERISKNKEEEEKPQRCYEVLQEADFMPEDSAGNIWILHY